MPYLTMKEKSKATTKPWFSCLLQHPAKKRSGSILGHNTHTHIFTHLLTFPGPTQGTFYVRRRMTKTLCMVDTSYNSHTTTASPVEAVCPSTTCVNGTACRHSTSNSATLHLHSQL